MAVAGVFSGRLAQVVPFKLQLAGASAVIALSCVALALLACQHLGGGGDQWGSTVSGWGSPMRR